MPGSESASLLPVRAIDTATKFSLAMLLVCATAGCDLSWGSSGPPPKDELLELLVAHESEFLELRDLCLEGLSGGPLIGGVRQSDQGVSHVATGGDPASRFWSLCKQLGVESAEASYSQRVVFTMYTKAPVGMVVSIMWGQPRNVRWGQPHFSGRHHVERLHHQWWMETIL